MSKIIAVLLAAACALTGIGLSVVNYTEGTPIKATQREYKFDKDTLLIGGYYGREDELQYAADADIDFLITNGISDSYMDTASRLGVGIIAAGASGMRSFYGVMNEADGDTWVNYNYANLKDYDALWGVDLIDEPNAPSYAPIQNATSAFYANTQKLLPLVNLFPSYANNEQLTEYPEENLLTKICSLFFDSFTNSTMRYKMYVSDYINTIDTDYICVDIYPYSATLNAAGETVKVTNTSWLRNLDLLAEACRETGRDLWVITQAAGETPDAKGEDEQGRPRWCDEKSDINQQAYASLAFGTKAVIHGLFGRDGWWDSDSHMIGSDGKPTETYYAAQAVNAELKAFADVYGSYQYRSTYLLNKRKVAGTETAVFNCTVESEKGNISSKNGLLVGTFDGDGKGYVIANMEELNKNVTATAKVTVPGGKTATVYQAGEAKTFTSDFTVTLTPGEGVFVTVK